MTKDYGYLKTLDAVKRLADKIGETDRPIGFDIETGYEGPNQNKASLYPHSGAFIVGFSMTVDTRWARYVPLRHELGVNLDEDEVWPIVKPLLESGRLVCHNAKFEKRHLRKVGIELGILSDTMIEAYVLSEWRSFGLKKLVKDAFGHNMTELRELFPDLLEKEKDTMRFNRVMLNAQTVEYACEDAVWCLALHELLYERVLRERATIFKVEMGIMELMCDVEDRGVEIDWPGIERARAESEPFITKYEEQLKKELGTLVGRSLVGVNLNSPPQMRRLLYEPAPEGLGLKTTRLTKKDKPSTDAIAMARLAKKYPAVQQILELREIQNLKKRFELWLEVDTRKSPKDPRKSPIRGRDGRVHAGYAQTVVGTGRFAANDPPIQQCPKDWRWDLTEGGSFEGNFRDFIIAAPGHYLLGFDYSQIELRVMAGLSKEPALLDAFNNDKDVHTITAAMMLGKTPEAVNPKTERPIGKTMNFALMYGMGAQSLGERLAISKERADELYASYFAGFPSITRWMDKMKQDGIRNGYTISCFGRKFIVWELKDSNPAVFKKGERILVNAPVQGGAADYVKIAMLRVKNALVKAGWWNREVRMIMNQHDALNFEISQDLDPREVIRLLRPAVEFPVKGFPKIVTDWEFGYRWGSCTPCNEDTWFVKEAEGWEAGTVLSPPPEPGVDGQRVETHVIVDARYRTPVAVTERVPRIGKTVMVELLEMPDSDNYPRFQAWLREHQGLNTVVLRTPEGEFPTDEASSLDLTDQARVATIFPGARVYYPPDQVDTEVLSADLTF